jgi:hypothetical protein
VGPHTVALHLYAISSCGSRVLAEREHGSLEAARLAGTANHLFQTSAVGAAYVSAARERWEFLRRRMGAWWLRRGRGSGQGKFWVEGDVVFFQEG